MTDEQQLGYVPRSLKAKRVRKQKTDRNDAGLLLKMLLENNFPKFGCPVRRIVICVNCFGPGIGCS